ncbi:hypothetical protein TPA0910_29520 [Streptomyces hygroscopicus subsp. sporocinereus]|uniref:Uncharacterized protein n=2 Tax=Streptomyces hygroscopicus TaxID=1912 RepID=A0ABQ3TYR3_STRHY|nr:hypothetical protein TPA0910_29520 [Streptomyces hygroscopicus]
MPRSQSTKIAHADHEELKLTPIQVEALCLLAAHQDRYDSPVDSTTLEWYFGKGVEEHSDESWVHEVVKGGFVQNIAHAISRLHQHRLVDVDFKGYAITSTGLDALGKHAKELQTDVDTLKKPAVSRVTRNTRRLDSPLT